MNDHRPQGNIKYSLDSYSFSRKWFPTLTIIVMSWNTAPCLKRWRLSQVQWHIYTPVVPALWISEVQKHPCDFRPARAIEWDCLQNQTKPNKTKDWLTIYISMEEHLPSIQNFVGSISKTPKNDYGAIYMGFCLEWWLSS